MFRRTPGAQWRALGQIITLVVVLAACSATPVAEERMPREAEPTASPTVELIAQPTMEPTAVPEPSPTAAPRLSDIRPNELGDLMVLEYHVIGDEELRWTRTREHFRQDLDYLHRHGYHLTGLNDLLDNRVRVPAGKTPVVLTFDDSNRSQFQFIVDPNGDLKVDPSSGLGILEAFIAEHPDFGRAAVFCVLPGADPPNDLFGQPEYGRQKLQYLAQRGYEICNHTLWHANLAEVGEKETVRQLALTTNTIQEAVPGYQVNVFNPPHGVYPEDLRPVLAGTFEGVSYRHRAILEVGGGPMTAPDHQETDFLHVKRTQAIPVVLENVFRHFEEHPEDRYVSDGDPDRVVFPARLTANYRPSPDASEEPSPDPGYRVIRLR
ncbi:MAG: polysaccharide deacetylase family protein [Chloroflexi bacterium]|nr:polysaccharide deacetylase family protein [Chloroflexota bacterium]